MKHIDTSPQMIPASEYPKEGVRPQLSVLTDPHALSVPKLSYDVELFGPNEEDRAQYIDLLSRANEFEAAGNLVNAAAAKTLAQSLVKRKWAETIHNLVTTVGKNDIIDKYFKGSAYTAAWYLGLKGAGTIAAGDTLASHGGWSEVAPYSGNRPTITFGTTSAGSNTATTVSVSITSSATVAGAFIASVNTGTSGILYSAADFGSARSVVNGDTLNVTPTVSVS